MDRSNPSLGCTYFNQLSYRYVAGDADAILELDVTDDLRGPNGGVHAGITSVLADVAGSRLAHVVEQGGQAQRQVGLGFADHGDGVGQHVLVAVDGVCVLGFKLPAV